MRDHIWALPNALSHVLANRDINDDDYENFIQLEK